MLASSLAEAKVSTFPAHDTLNVELVPPATEDEAAAIAGLEWEPGPFEVTAMSAPLDDGGPDAFVFFPSPRLSGDKTQDKVGMEWYSPRDSDGTVPAAKALLLVHTLHPGMPLERAIARRVADRGHHVFLIHMPGYGFRDDGGLRDTGVTAILHNAQSVSDIRRARDAVAALPNIANEPVGILGVSLGGFAAATAASLDRAFDPVMIVISGGDGYRVLQEGGVDARYLRESLAVEGFSGDKLRNLLYAVEPLRLAHRLDRDRTWLLAAKVDQVIPRFSSDALAKKARLASSHYLVWSADHYTFALWTPAVATWIDETLRRD